MQTTVGQLMGGDVVGDLLEVVRRLAEAVDEVRTVRPASDAWRVLSRVARMEAEDVLAAHGFRTVDEVIRAARAEGVPEDVIRDVEVLK